MFETLTLPQEEHLCPMVSRGTSTLEPNDLKIFLDALDDLRWTARNLATELTKRGFKVSENQIWKHRSKACACAR